MSTYLVVLSVIAYVVVCFVLGLGLATSLSYSQNWRKVRIPSLIGCTILAGIPLFGWVISILAMIVTIIETWDDVTIQDILNLFSKSKKNLYDT